MARSLDQISTDLAKLDTATQELDQTLQAVYQDYLGVLSQAVKRQLVLAAYHLCTQTYPDKFLALTVAQREQLQANLRQIASQGHTQIVQLGQKTDLTELAAQLEEAVVAKYGKVSDSADADESSPTPLSSSPEESTLPLIEEIEEIETTADQPPAAISLSESSSTDEGESLVNKSSDEASMMLKRLGTSLSLFSMLEADPPTPISLAKRHVLLERHLRAVLRTLSSLTNHLLKQNDVLPDLPDMVIAAATEADGENTGPSMPNLVSILVELAERHSDRDEDQDEELDDEDETDAALEEADPNHDMTHLVAINLRLADIEFADHQTALWRGRLQETLHKLKRLGSRYQTLQREKARAEAEHAWRAVWFEG